jgi:hypothetical protein
LAGSEAIQHQAGIPLVRGTTPCRNARAGCVSQFEMHDPIDGSPTLVAVGAEHFAFGHLGCNRCSRRATPDQVTNIRLLNRRIEVIELEDYEITFPALSTRMLLQKRVNELCSCSFETRLVAPVPLKVGLAVCRVVAARQLAAAGAASRMRGARGPILRREVLEAEPA